MEKITITIDSGLKKWLKVNNIKISSLINELLLKYQKSNLKDFENAYKLAFNDKEQQKQIKIWEKLDENWD